MPRAVVDTNVWVSGSLNPSGAPARILALLRQQRFTPIVSSPLLDELRDVLGRPRIGRKYGISQADIEDLIALIRRHADEVVVTGSIRLCRDPDDDVVIETALRGNADVLVTHDDDLKGPRRSRRCSMSRALRY